MKRVLAKVIITTLIVTAFPVLWTDAAIRKISINEKKYAVDLDGDGKKETITWEKEKDDIDDYYRLIVNINGKKAFKSEAGLCTELFVGDLKQKDKKKELLTVVTTESEGLAEIAAYRYKPAKKKTVKVFREKSKRLGALDLYRMSSREIKLNGDGTVILGAEAADSRVSSSKYPENSGVGQYYECRMYEVTGGHLRDISGADREVLQGTEYNITAPINAYSEIGGTNITVSFKTGDTFVMKKVHYDLSNGRLTHIFVEGKAGSGWITVPDTPFVDLQYHQWG